MKAITHLLALLICSACAQNTPFEKIEKLSKDGYCYACIQKLSEDTPARMSGSINNHKAIQYLKDELESCGIHTTTDTVEVPNWQPGHTQIHIAGETTELTSAPLGLSVGTDGQKLQLKVVEFKNKEEFEKTTTLNGCAAFFNEKMDTTENGYSKAGWQRMAGASMAARKGAEAVLTRSLSPTSDQYPRTGTLRYEDGVRKIPAVAISTADADILASKLQQNPNLEVSFTSTSRHMGTASGTNLIGELKGSVHPERIILISAHIDSWFNSQGAQDNATGCAQAISILRNLSEAGIKPINTIRVLIYQDEEISMAGMKKYIEKYGHEPHLLNLELDSGAEAPVGFALFDSESRFNQIKAALTDTPLQAKLEHYPAEAASFWPLSAEKDVPVYFYMAERKDYFSIHHSEVDNISLINQDDIAKSCEMITNFIYIIDSIYR